MSNLRSKVSPPSVSVFSFTGGDRRSDEFGRGTPTGMSSRPRDAGESGEDLVLERQVHPNLVGEGFNDGRGTGTVEVLKTVQLDYGEDDKRKRQKCS